MWVFLADTSLPEDACNLCGQLAGHLEAVGGTEADTALASVLINLGSAEVGIGCHQAALATFTRASDLIPGQRPERGQPHDRRLPVLPRRPHASG